MSIHDRPLTETDLVELDRAAKALALTEAHFRVLDRSPVWAGLLEEERRLVFGRPIGPRGVGDDVRLAEELVEALERLTAKVRADIAVLNEPAPPVVFDIDLGQEYVAPGGPTPDVIAEIAEVMGLAPDEDDGR